MFRALAFVTFAFLIETTIVHVAQSQSEALPTPSFETQTLQLPELGSSATSAAPPPVLSDLPPLTDTLNLNPAWDPLAVPDPSQVPVLQQPPAIQPQTPSLPGPAETTIVPTEQCCTQAPNDTFIPGPAIKGTFQ